MHTITNWPQLLRYLCDWRHVVIGPFVRQLWQSHGIADAPHNKHFNALCFFCEHAAKSGPCEHAYAAMVCAGLISTTPPPVPKQSGRPRKKPRAAGATAALVPGPSLPREAAPNVKPAGDAQASAPDPLEALLRSAGLSAYLPTVRQTGATLHMLRSMDSLTDFRTFFGMSLGDAFALRAALQNWKDATEATQNDDACAAPSSAAAQKPRPKEQSSRQRDPDFFYSSTPGLWQQAVVPKSRSASAACRKTRLTPPCLASRFARLRCAKGFILLASTCGCHARIC